MEPLDFTTAEETSFEPLPKGTYLVSLFKGETAETKGTSKLGVRPMLKFQLRVSDDDSSDYSGRMVFGQLVVPPKNLDGQPYEHFDRMMGNIKTFYKALGFTDAEINKFKKFPDWDDVTGREMKIMVKVRRDENYGDSNDIVTFKPAQGEPAASGLSAL